MLLKRQHKLLLKTSFISIFMGHESFSQDTREKLNKNEELLKLYEERRVMMSSSKKRLVEQLEVLINNIVQRVVKALVDPHQMLPFVHNYFARLL